MVHVTLMHVHDGSMPKNVNVNAPYALYYARGLGAPVGVGCELN